jgi:hypothetical protein
LQRSAQQRLGGFTVGTGFDNQILLCLCQPFAATFAHVT